MSERARVLEQGPKWYRCAYLVIFIKGKSLIVIVLNNVGVNRFGLAVRLVSRGTSVRIRFGSPFSSKAVVCGHCLVTLSLAVNETLKWLSSLPILMQESFWW